MRVLSRFCLVVAPASQAAEDEMPKAEDKKQEILNLFFEKHKSALKEEGEERKESWTGRGTAEVPELLRAWLRQSSRR